jgi:beta-N-acetylhexosaminidase
MSPERVAAGCLLPGFAGTRAPDWVLRRVEGGLGGVVLFARNVSGELTDLCAELGDEVLIAIDEEGGDVTRLEAERGSSFPGNLALGAVDDVVLTERVAAAIGGELASVGVNVNLAPVADANTNPANPIVGVRAFGSDPRLVARHVAAYVRGMQSVGVAACAKHFPGHGDTSGDSHLELPTVEGDLEAALLPFRAAIEAGVRCIMPGHLLVPALDSEPASLSRRIVTDLLRGELGFDGCVITDALEMKAVSATVGIEESAVRALEAGADALCIGHDVDDELTGRIQRAVVDAVRSGRLDSARLEEAASRIAEAIRTPGDGRGTVPGSGVGAEAARLALRTTGPVRLGGTPQVIVLETEPTIAAGRIGFGFADAIRAVWPAATVTEVHHPGTVPRLSPGSVVVAMRDAGRHRWQRDFVTKLLQERPDGVVVETGLPSWLPEGAATVTTYGAARVNLEAAVAALAQRRTADAIPS